MQQEQTLIKALHASHIAHVRVKEKRVEHSANCFYTKKETNTYNKHVKKARAGEPAHSTCKPPRKV